MKTYPRSFLQLVTLGHVLVIIPFVLVTAYVFLTLERLDTQYGVAVESLAATSRLSGEITQGLLRMERGLRRYEILKDTASLNDYAQIRKEWQDDLAKFARVPALDEELRSELQAQIEHENAVYAALLDTPPAAPAPVAKPLTGMAAQVAAEQNEANANAIAAVRAMINGLRSRWQTVQANVSQILAAEQARFKGEADALRERMLIALACALVVALASIWASRRLLSRLIGRFEQVVVRLGRGELQQRIALTGPGDLRWLGRWLEWLRRRLLSLEESRTRMLRHVSHELKGPLAALREGSNLLAEEVPGSLTAEQARIVQILQSNSKRLQDLIEGVLRLQQAEYVAERIGVESLRYDALIEQVLETYRLIAGERQIAFEANLAPVTIVAGREGLLTIVNNLLSNAVKFSPTGGKVQIELSQRGQRACLEVRDEGKGISDEERAKIFEPFYRSPGSRQIAGVGLGLAIVREFVVAYRGEITLVKSPRGAHFRVWLPLQAEFARTP